MFGFGHGPELIIILVIALIVLGPGKIPEVAQMLGKGIRELRQASSDLQKTFDVNELINPTPPAPEPPPAAAAGTETILPPADAAAKPKRSRKRLAGDEASANGAEPPPAGNRPPRPRRKLAVQADTPVAAALADGAQPAAGDRPEPVPSANGAGEAAAKPAARRRPSKKTTEPVSLDAPA